jgi:hypothetical protein
LSGIATKEPTSFSAAGLALGIGLGVRAGGEVVVPAPEGSEQARAGGEAMIARDESLVPAAQGLG